MTLLAEAPFAYRQKTFKADDVAGMTQAMHEDGFALVPGVLTPEECAAAVAFLASPAAAHITGETLMVDAGMHLGPKPMQRA